MASRKTSVREDFGRASKELVGEVIATVTVDEHTGAVETGVYCPWATIPAESIGDVVRVLQRAAEWALAEREVAEKRLAEENRLAAERQKAGWRKL